MNGGTKKGELSAPDESGVAAFLRRDGYYPVKITRLGDERPAIRGKIKPKPLAGFCSQVAVMLRAGVPVAKILEILKEQTDDKPLRLIIAEVYGAILKGSSLSGAFTPYSAYFPDVFLNMVEAGETSGRLDACLERAGNSFTRTAKLNNKVRNAMIYPSIVLFVMIGLLVIMLVVVIPAFSNLYADSGAQLPAFTRGLVAVSDALKQYWYAFLLAAGVIVFGFRAWKNSDGGRLFIDRAKLQIPAIKKLLVKVYAARFSRTLSSLLAAGVALPQALTVTARSVSNRHIEDGIYKMVDAVSRGEEMSAPLERMGLLPPMVTYMTKLGEESGTVVELLNQAAEYYDEESDAALQAMMSMMEPALIILMAVIVVPVLIAVMLPMFNMYSLIG